MLNKIYIGNYYPEKSNVHDMNPLSKIICAFLFILMTLFSGDLEISGILTLLVMIMIMNTDIPLVVYYRILKNLKYILLTLFIAFLLATFSFWSAITVLLNASLIIAYVSILTLTTSPTEIIYGIERLLIPLKYFDVNISKIALNIGLGLRFIPTVIDQGENILKSEASRGIDKNNSFKEWFIAVKGMIVPAVTLSVRRFNNLKIIMSLRLFGINKTRTNYRINKWRLFDTYLLVIHLAIMIIIIMRGVLS